MAAKEQVRGMYAHVGLSQDYRGCCLLVAVAVHMPRCLAPYHTEMSLLACHLLCDWLEPACLIDCWLTHLLAASQLLYCKPNMCAFSSPSVPDLLHVTVTLTTPYVCICLCVQ